MQWDAVTDLSELIGSIFCVTTVELEEEVDRYLTGMVRHIMTGRVLDTRAKVKAAMPGLLQNLQSGYVSMSASRVDLLSKLHQFPPN